MWVRKTPIFVTLVEDGKGGETDGKLNEDSNDEGDDTTGTRGKDRRGNVAGDNQRV